MSIKKRTQDILNNVLYIAKNPSLYVAVSVGTLIGVISGSAVGALSGGFIGAAYPLGTYTVYQLQINLGMALGALLGLCLGGLIGGILIGSIAIFKIHKKTHQLQGLWREDISSVVLSTIWISVEMVIGMDVGAIIGSLKMPGSGTVIGSLAGIALMLFTTILEKKQKNASVDAASTEL